MTASAVEIEARINADSALKSLKSLRESIGSEVKAGVGIAEGAIAHLGTTMTTTMASSAASVTGFVGRFRSEFSEFRSSVDVFRRVNGESITDLSRRWDAFTDNVARLKLLMSDSSGTTELGKSIGAAADKSKGLAENMKAFGREVESVRDTSVFDKMAASFGTLATISATGGSLYNLIASGKTAIEIAGQLGPVIAQAGGTLVAGAAALAGVAGTIVALNVLPSTDSKKVAAALEADIKARSGWQERLFDAVSGKRRTRGGKFKDTRLVEQGEVVEVDTDNPEWRARAEAQLAEDRAKAEKEAAERAKKEGEELLAPPRKVSFKSTDDLLKDNADLLLEGLAESDRRREIVKLESIEKYGKLRQDAREAQLAREVASEKAVDDLRQKSAQRSAAREKHDLERERAYWGQLTGLVIQGTTSMISSMIAGAVAGEKIDFKRMFGGLLLSIGEAMIGMGTAAVLAGTLGTVAPWLLGPTGGPAGVLAGAALIAGGAVFVAGGAALSKSTPPAPSRNPQGTGAYSPPSGQASVFGTPEGFQPDGTGTGPMVTNIFLSGFAVGSEAGLARQLQGVVRRGSALRST